MLLLGTNEKSLNHIKLGVIFERGEGPKSNLSDLPMVTQRVYPVYIITHFLTPL